VSGDRPDPDCADQLRRWPEFDTSRIRRIDFQERDNKVTIADFGQPSPPSGWAAWLDSLPHQLAADRLRLLVERLRAVRGSGGELIWMLGGHVVKTGVSPYLSDLLARGFVTTLAVNGSTSIHDVEVALFGRTSEDVQRNLEDGRFGMVRQTGDFFFAAYRQARADGCGMGEGIARHLERTGAAHRQQSLLHAAWRHDVPCTVHVALGCDILHQQPGAEGAEIGELSLRDFRILAERTRRLAPEGVVVNLGSAVIMPEVFLKAYTMARNLGCRPRRLTTANLDMIQHYRPQQNVLSRPTAWGGESIALTGHHEILVPLLHALLVEGEPERADD
jgi:hypothetical protein